MGMRGEGECCPLVLFGHQVTSRGIFCHVVVCAHPMASAALSSTVLNDYCLELQLPFSALLWFVEALHVIEELDLPDAFSTGWPAKSLARLCGGCNAAVFTR